MPAGLITRENKVPPLNEKEHEYNNEDGENQPLLGTGEKNFRWSWRYHVHEPTLFFFMLAFALSSNCDSNLYMDRACKLIFNRTTEECNGNDTHLSDQIQKTASSFILYVSLVSLVPAMILGVFVGAWSDKYGRKPLIYVAMIGTILSSLGKILFVAEPRTPLYFVLILGIPAGLTGSLISVLSCVYTLASESTRPEMRTLKYASLQISATFAMPLGVLTSGLIFGSFGYMPVYILSSSCYVLSILWFFFFVKDEGVKTQAPLKTMVVDFFNCDRIKESVAVALKKRPNNGRMEIILLCVSMCLIVVNYVAVQEIMYLFCKKVFHWNLTYYSNVNTISSVCGALFLMVSVPILHKVFGLSDAWIALLGCVTLLAQLILKAFSLHPWTYFLALTVGLPSSTAPMSIRARLSKIIDKGELGKVFTVLAIMESCVPVVGTILITQVYNASVEFFPGLIMLITAVLLCFPIVVLRWVIHKSRSIQEAPRENSNVSEESSTTNKNYSINS